MFFLRERNTLGLALTERNIHQHRTGLSQRCRYSGARVAHPLGYQRHQVGPAQAPSHTAEELPEHCRSAPKVSAQEEEQPEHCSSPNTNVGAVSQTSSQLQVSLLFCPPLYMYIQLPHDDLRTSSVLCQFFMKNNHTQHARN